MRTLDALLKVSKDFTLATGIEPAIRRFGGPLHKLV
jgi:hypothetical protein